MTFNSDIDEIKRKLRGLKRLEIKIRFGGSYHAANFDGNSKSRPVYAGSAGRGKAKYSPEDIASMGKDEFRNIIDEFFYSVYYKYYMENGITGAKLYDPEILGWMGLKPDAGQEEIKKKFRELAKKYHPDTGGDSSSFIKLMDNYRKLID